MLIRSGFGARVAMRDGTRTWRRAAALAAWLWCGGAAADEAAPAGGTAPRDYVHAWLGAIGTDDTWTVARPAPDEDLVGGLGTLPFGGGAAQRLWGEGGFRLGYEGGGLISWKNHDTQFVAASGSGGGVLAVATENTFLSVGVFMGAVASLQLTDHLRVQLAAGPALTWARLDAGDEPSSDPEPAMEVDDVSDDVSFVPYGRVGLEVVLDNGFAIGASMRYANDRFDFGDNGDLEMDEIMWVLTLGSPL